MQCVKIQKLISFLVVLLTVFAVLSFKAEGQGQQIDKDNIAFFDYPGFPEQHSTWNDIGYNSTHDKVYVGVTDHKGKVALYEYDVADRVMENKGFIAKMANLRDHQWQGKVHSKFVEGPDGEMFFSTDGGVQRSVDFRNHPRGYSGGYFMKYNPASEKLTNLGIGMKHEGLKDMDVDPHSGLVYGVTFPQVHFIVYDPSSNDLRDLGRLGGGHVPRVMFTDEWGNCYYVDWRQRLVKYEKSKDKLVFAEQSLPTFPGTPGYTIITGITAYAKDRSTGTIYFVTYGAKMIAFNPQKEGIGQVTDLGAAVDTGDDELWRPYIPNLNFGDNGKLYYVIGGHGNFVKEETTLLVEMDPETGERRIIYEFPVSEIMEATGSDIKDKQGNLYYAGRKSDSENGSRPFLIKFNPEKEVKK